MVAAVRPSRVPTGGPRGASGFARLVQCTSLGRRSLVASCAVIVIAGAATWVASSAIAICAHDDPFLIYDPLNAAICIPRNEGSCLSGWVRRGIGSDWVLLSLDSDSAGCFPSTGALLPAWLDVGSMPPANMSTNCVIELRAFGWPCRALWYGEQTEVRWSSEEEWEPTLIGAVRFSGLPQRPLPYLICWPGAALNLAAMALVLLVPLFATGTVVRYMRRQGCRCFKCGYCLLPEQELCPECGMVCPR